MHTKFDDHASCQTCGAAYVVEYDNSGQVTDYRCANPDCPGRSSAYEESPSYADDAQEFFADNGERLGL